MRYIWHRTRLGATEDLELDVEAAAGKEMWICESKWWENDRVAVKAVRSLLYKADLLREREGPGLQILRLWMFAYNGFTKGAIKLMQQERVFWSDRQDLKGLLMHVGLKQLPEI